MIIIYSLVFSFTTYELAKIKTIGAIRASCLVGLASILITDHHFIDVEASFLFGATFIGMSSAKRFSRVRLIVAASLYPYIYPFLQQYFAGVGGLLGMSAFLAVLCVSYKTKAT